MKKLLYLLILIISLFISNNLIRSISNLWQKNHLVGDAQRELQLEKNENEKLKDQLSRVKRPDFVEGEARDKLFMVKPGEKMVLLGQDTTSKPKAEPTSTKPSANWQQWVAVFFKE